MVSILYFFTVWRPTFFIWQIMRFSALLNLHFFTLRKKCLNILVHIFFCSCMSIPLVKISGNLVTGHDIYIYHRLLSSYSPNSFSNRE